MTSCSIGFGGNETLERMEPIRNQFATEASGREIERPTDCGRDEKDTQLNHRETGAVETPDTLPTNPETMERQET